MLEKYDVRITDNIILFTVLWKGVSIDYNMHYNRDTHSLFQHLKQRQSIYHNGSWCGEAHAYVHVVCVCVFVTSDCDE